MVCLCLAISNYTASCRTGFLKRCKFLKQISHIVQQVDIEKLSRPLDFQNPTIGIFTRETKTRVIPGLDVIQIEFSVQAIKQLFRANIRMNTTI